MQRLTFRKPERKKLADAVADAVTRVVGTAPTDREHYHSDEIHSGLPKGLETRNGPIEWAWFEVCPRGLSVHIKFSDPERAARNCAGINPYSGKWNHYLWPDSANIEGVVAALLPILRQLRPA